MAKWSFKGAYMPLFDRLTDEEFRDPGEEKPRVTLDKTGVLESIRTEVENLLNTRAVLPQQDYEALDDEARIYGIPALFGLSDFSQIDGANMQSWHHSEELITRAISYYEPRLIDPIVKLKRYDNMTQQLYVEISGSYKVGNTVERISFPIAIEDGMIKK